MRPLRELDHALNAIGPPYQNPKTYPQRSSAIRQPNCATTLATDSVHPERQLLLKTHSVICRTKSSLCLAGDVERCHLVTTCVWSSMRCDKSSGIASSAMMMLYSPDRANSWFFAPGAVAAARKDVPADRRWTKLLKYGPPHNKHHQPCPDEHGERILKRRGRSGLGRRDWIGSGMAYQFSDPSKAVLGLRARILVLRAKRGAPGEIAHGHTAASAIWSSVIPGPPKAK
jgi:hypothetical protein